MSLYPKAINTLIALLQSLPAVGPKTAERYALAIRTWPPSKFETLVKVMSDISIGLFECAGCGLTVDQKGYCVICASRTRLSNVLCLVERESDAEALERVGTYQGRYFILGGLASPTRSNARVAKRLAALKSRLVDDPIDELIIALNPTPLGDATAAMVQHGLPAQIKITRLGRGLATGSDVAYADASTLSNALSQRENITSKR